MGERDEMAADILADRDDDIGDELADRDGYNLIGQPFPELYDEGCP